MFIVKWVYTRRQMGFTWEDKLPFALHLVSDVYCMLILWTDRISKVRTHASAVCFLFLIFVWFLATGGGGLFDEDEGDDDLFLTPTAPKPTAVLSSSSSSSSSSQRKEMCQTEQAALRCALSLSLSCFSSLLFSPPSLPPSLSPSLP